MHHGLVPHQMGLFLPLGAASVWLLEIKCPNIPNYVEAPDLKVINGSLQLKPTHAYYWQVQGQLFVTCMSWLA